VHATPAVSCAISAKEAHTSIQVKRRHSGIPCAMVLRLIPRSPRRRIRLVTVVSGLTARPARLGEVGLRGLGASNGRQDHTASPYAYFHLHLGPAACRAEALAKADKQLRRLARRHRSRGSSRPATTAGALETAASTTFQAHVRDDRDTPSPRAGTDGTMPLIWVFGKAEYF
jgi:hypothetical protein